MADTTKQRNPPVIKWWHTLLSGFLAGTISRTVTAPLDRLKVLSQEGRIAAWQAATCHPTVHMIADASKRNIKLSRLVKHSYAEGGWSSFWRGNGINCMKAGPEIGILFVLRQFFMDVFQCDKGAMAGNFLCAAMSGAVAQCLLYPLETTKTRMAVAATGEYRGIMDCVRQSHQRGGFRDFYRGLTANLAGVVPYRGLEVGSFYVMRSSLQAFKATHGDDASGPSNSEVAVMGAISSIFSQTVTYPLNVVRTRLQTQGVNGRPHLYNGMFDCFTTIVTEEGLRAVFAGLSANYLKAVPASVITFIIVENCQRALAQLDRAYF